METTESHMRKPLLIHQILPQIMETTGSSRCHVRNSLDNSLGVISSNENRHAKISCRKSLCSFSVLPCVSFIGIVSMFFFFGRTILPVDGVIVLSPYDLSYIPEPVYM